MENAIPEKITLSWMADRAKQFLQGKPLLTEISNFAMRNSLI
jgi:hypothetical protein